MITRYSRLRYDDDWTAAIFLGGPLQFRRHDLTDERLLYLTRWVYEQAADETVLRMIWHHDFGPYEQSQREAAIYELVFQFWPWLLCNYWQDSK